MYVSRTKEVTVESYFFANRNTHWLILGISLLTSCIFSPYFFGLTSSGSTSGLPIAYGLVSAIMLAVLGWFLAPLYLKAKIDTVPEYFERRFNRTCRSFLSALYLFYNFFIRLMIILVAGSAFINRIAGLDAYSSLLFFLIIAGIYVIIGGLQGEIYASIVQVLFIILGVAGFTGWVVNQSNGINSVVHQVASVSYLDAGAHAGSTWTGLILGLPIVGFWFWCADQFTVQKVLSVRNVCFARRATLFSGFLQVIPIVVSVVAAIIVVTLFPNASSGETVRILFSSGFLPDSVRWGLIIAVAAALMASFAGLFNSTSLLVTFDFYRTLKPDASDRKLVLVGRMTTMILLFCSILLIPISQAIDFDLCLKLFKIFAYFAAMITAVFVTALLHQRISAMSALWTLCAGTAVILLRAALEIGFDDHRFGNSLLEWFARSEFLEFSVFVFFLSVSFLFVFNKLGWVQPAASSFLRVLKRMLLKLKYGWTLHKTLFLVVLALITVVALGHCLDLI